MDEAWSYWRGEFGHLGKSPTDVKVKFEAGDGATRWLLLTDEQFKTLRATMLDIEED